MGDKMRDIIFELAKESVKEYIKNFSNARIQAISNVNIPKSIRDRQIRFILSICNICCLFLTNLRN